MVIISAIVGIIQIISFFVRKKYKDNNYLYNPFINRIIYVNIGKYIISFLRFDVLLQKAINPSIFKQNIISLEKGKTYNYSTKC